MGRTVAIVSQKGGVGKTTVTLGIASAAQAAGHRVLVIDLDPQASSSWILGVDPAKVELSSAEVVGKGSIGKSIVPSAWGDGVDLIPASSRLLAKEASTNKDAPLRLRAALAAVEFYDAVLIDCPPSLGNLTTNAPPQETAQPGQQVDDRRELGQRRGAGGRRRVDLSERRCAKDKRQRLSGQ